MAGDLESKPSCLPKGLPLRSRSPGSDRAKMKLDFLNLTLDEEPLAADWNMAIDEALLLTSSSATLRCYGWRGEAVSFGYFNKWESIARLYLDRPYVRRWTGGGIVEHGKDFTYSLVIPIGLGKCGTTELYEFVHLAIARALSELGYVVEIIQTPDRGETAGCFERAVAFDLKVDGKKIAGAAVRRNQQGILLQGSIQRVTIPLSFGTMLSETLADRVLPLPISLRPTKLAARLVAEKYGAEAWNHRF
jgi:lipoyl(octanoyl) transferase